MRTFSDVNSGVAALLPSGDGRGSRLEVKVIEEAFDGVEGVVPFLAPVWFVYALPSLLAS